MDEYRIRGRYDLWRGVWQIVESNLPGLSVEAPKRELFVAEIERACEEHADGRAYQVTVTTAVKKIWTLESRFVKQVLVNGKLQTREQVADLKARYQAAG
jgi:hypothetical protein